MHLRLPTGSSKPHRLMLLIALLLLGGTMTAQETREAQQETARKLITEAFQLKGDGTAPSLSKAIEKFEAAKVLCRSLKNFNAEADLFGQIGFLYDELEQHQKAIENYTQSLPLYRVAGDKTGEIIGRHLPSRGSGDRIRDTSFASSPISIDIVQQSVQVCHGN